MKKAVKILKWTLGIAAGLFMAVLIFVWAMAEFQPKIGHADAVIVLGAAIYTPALNNRSLQGLKLYQEHKAETLVLSGGRKSDKDISEARYMQKVILGHTEGSVANMIVEDQSHTTWENIQNSKKLIPEAKSVIIVSDTYHLARSVLVAKREGFEKVYWSSPNSSSYYKKSELAYHYLRETVAIFDYLPKLIVNK